MAAGLFAMPGIASGATPPWSKPVVNTYDPEPGVRQRVEQSKRHYKEGEARTLESQVKFNLKTPGWEGDYLLHRKQVYEGTRLVTFYKKMEGDIRGRSNFQMSEQTQIAKNSRGDFKGTFLREYVFGRRGPAVRLMVHFDPYLLVKRFKAKLSVREENGAWEDSLQARGESLGQSIARLHGKIVSGPADSQEPISQFLMALWAGALAHGNSMEMAQFLYPLLGSGGDRYFQEVSVDPVLERSREALASFGTRQADVAHWERLSRDLSRRRAALGRAFKAADPAGEASMPLRIVDLYADALRPLLYTPKRPAPSALQGLQSSCGWMASAFADFKALNPGSRGYQQYLAALPGKWSSVLLKHRSEVYMRTLYVLQIHKELRALDALVAGADAALPGGLVGPKLKQVQGSLSESAKTWTTPLARGPAPERWPGTFLALLKLPWRSLIGEAWGADPDTIPTEFAELGFSENPMGLPGEVANPQSFLESPRASDAMFDGPARGGYMELPTAAAPSGGAAPCPPATTK